MELRAFPVLHAKDVESVASFYAHLGFSEHARVPQPDGTPGFIGLRRGAAELAVTTEQSPRELAGVEPGTAPRGELFVYVSDVDEVLQDLPAAGATVLREPADMPWGERLAFIADPEGNLVTLATARG